MLEYLRKVQRPKRNSSLHITLPKTLVDILSLSKGDTVVCSLATANNQKVIFLKKLAVETAATELGVTQ